MSFGVFIKGSRRRTADTPAERVNLIARGWKLAEDVPQPPEPTAVAKKVEDNPPPPPPSVPANDVPPAEGKGKSK
jgi:hypothetical protein